MWTIAKEFSFDAAHQLPYHDGKCARLHGHTYKCKLFLKSDRLILDGPKKAMVQDFGDVKGVFKPLMDTYLDHHFLNDTLETDETTAEYIAQWIYQQVKPLLPLLVAVQIDETCTSACIYSEDHNAPD